MTRSDTLRTLSGLLMLLRNQWSADGHDYDLDLRFEVGNEIMAALEEALPVLEQAPCRPNREGERQEYPPADVPLKRWEEVKRA